MPGSGLIYAPLLVRSLSSLVPTHQLHAPPHLTVDATRSHSWTSEYDNLTLSGMVVAAMVVATSSLQELWGASTWTG